MFGWKSSTAPRRMADLSGAWDGAAIATKGLVAGTRVATQMGWRVAEALAPGDMVLTFDNGLRPVREVKRDTFWTADAMEPARFAPLFVPAGALGNRVDMELLPDQGVLIESDAACDQIGDPFAVIPAHALAGFRGITRIPAPPRIDVVTLIFENEEVVYAEGGLMLHCPQAYLRIDELAPGAFSYDMVSARDAAFLVECMVVEEETRTCNPLYAGGFSYAHAA